MLVIILRTIIVFFVLFIVIRLMGKRQIGELQPFEFVITLVAAELACTPMQDTAIPVLYGVVPLAVIFILHFFGTLFTTFSISFRKWMNGKPVIVINSDGIDASELKKLNMDINDLLESIRGQGYFTVEQISYAIVETNGKLSVIPNDLAEMPKTIPLSLIVDGKIIADNVKISNTSEAQIDRVLNQKKLKRKDVILMTTESGKLFVQPKEGKFFTLQAGGN